MRYTFLYGNPQSYTTTLISAFIKEYGSGALSWEPLTIQLEIQDDEKLTSVPEITMDKLQAAMVVLTTNQFYQYIEAFENVGKVLNLSPPDFQIATPLSPEEAAWAVIEARIFDPALYAGDNAYSPEVLHYIRACMDSAGICMPYPEIFKKLKVPAGKCGCDEFPELKKEIEEQQNVKRLRVEAYVNYHYTRLTSEIKQYFPETKLPSLESLLGT